jgi:chitodextrinase
MSMKRFINYLEQLQEQKKLTKTQIYLATFGILLFLSLALTIPTYLLKQQQILRSQAQAAILWSAAHETGNLSQWDGEWNSGNADSIITTTYAHGGSYAVAETVNGNAGTRMAKDTVNGALLPDGYYSVWYYFPQVVRAPDWWNIFQFKRATYPYGAGSNPVFTVNVGNRASGEIYTYLYQHVGSDGQYNTAGQGVKAQATINIPTNRWMHFECYYKWAKTTTGQLTCWQDGQQIWDLQNVITEYNYAQDDNRMRQWSVNNYTSGTIPSTQTIYIDDAAISTSRLGPGGTGGGTTPTPPTAAPTATPTPTPIPQAPTAPGNLRATTVTASSVVLAWDASMGSVAQYNVWRGDANYANWVQVGTVPGTGTVFTDTSVLPNRTYTYGVRAQNASGAISNGSNNIKVTTPADAQAPSPASNLRAISVTTTSITMAWNAATDNVGVTRYEIWRADANYAHWVLAGTVSGSTFSFTNTSLASKRSYTYGIRAFDAAGNKSASSNLILVTTQ